ncbi:glutamine--fructose-6-phosphate transaminase (isomerizing) [Pokkaliibacter sp. MBI-7]|uniref:glutamine--fructose-6-phosphate transaminase (isomerizing) n=1 Tax=Pokkaliibacter sp. MBI-7 TaxID=3040600 RepID=UPI00244A9AC3|nr:glutamine--fructose-6-phosphate transaminase (isomerizing) [Pokkaliibacter sp. MBI-7]MDH2433078.1 glutamine--fructose-6-phosphate transaminase (isomerizing) [Pokkaliibacter sp. MBI-7]
MCGIVGAIAAREVSAILLEGQRRLEYRGYDSAGMAVFDGQELNRLRRAGKVQQLADALGSDPLHGHLGIAHTRWATHGQPNERNAHPHMSGERLAVVHNGIIENYATFKAELKDKGYVFTSDTDTEVIAHLLSEALKQESDLYAAFRQVINQLEGAFALGVIHADYPELLLCARKGSPLVIGVGMGENFIGSDPLALLQVTDRFIYLNEGDTACVSREQIEVRNARGEVQALDIKRYEHGTQSADKGQYKHYMLKEIFEQPGVIQATLNGRVGKGEINTQLFGDSARQLMDSVQAVQIIACGTSYHAGMVARYWIEELAGIPCQVEIASEYRYRKTITLPNTLFVTISQSGETADTLAALRVARERGALASLAICNVPGSSLVRESDLCLMTQAGPEIGVASTKAFTTQLSALMVLTLSLAKTRGLDSTLEAELTDALTTLPAKVEEVLALSQRVEQLATHFADKQHSLFLGRGALYPIALEGALKLKEISYIHAEAYPAGELKHGPLALVDSDMPVITVAPGNELLEKLKSNMQEVRARGGELYVFADQHAGIEDQEGYHILHLPKIHPLLEPILYTVPLQLLSYYVAVIRGTDVDQPRNLAKSVTVE